MTTLATLFSGFGGVEVGALSAGLEPIWGVEIDPAIVEVVRANLDHDIHVADILDCDPLDYDAPDVLHASPPCTNASVANANSGESELDMRLACRVAAFVTTLLPRIFTLENVWAYRNFMSWQMIEEALHRAGYWVSVEHVNAADYGVPQSRKRMIVRAVRGDFVPYLPTPVSWVGWYAAIEDLLPALPESQFANWQLARLPQLLQSTLVAQGGYDGKLVTADEDVPSFTLTANHNQLGVRAFLVQVQGEAGDGVRAGEHGGGSPRAWLVNGANAQPDGQLIIRAQDDPAITITAGGLLRGLLEEGRVVAMTPRALARFQSFPDWYELPDNARLAAKGIGNAVPPLLYQRIIAPLLEG